MTASTAVHSNAFNFMSFVQNGVDPRTGQYTLAISFPALQSHDLNGPEFPLVLNYNPLNTQDSGYGLGWDLKLSQYTPGTRILSLNTGETFKVTGSGIQPAIKEKKLDSFRFYDDGNGNYRVAHKSGLLEFLQEKGSAAHRIAVPVAIESASGQRIVLQWEPFLATQRLVAVNDTQRRLLAVSRSESTVHIDLHPDDGEQGAPRARYTLQLAHVDRRVARIVLPSEPQSSWELEYETVLGILCLKTVRSPTGSLETLEYRDNGHLYPDSARAFRDALGNPVEVPSRVLRALERLRSGNGRPGVQAPVPNAATPLPRVTRHHTAPGFGQPPIEVAYDYTLDGTDRGYNFLGRGAQGVVWATDGLDNLYQATNDYRYGSVETLMVDGLPVRTIERVFNRYHLLTLEKTTQNQCSKTVVTTYHLVEGMPFDLQPAQCQLPSKVATTWTNVAQATPRTEEEFTRFDESGNPTLSTTANGVSEISHWYPAQATDGCPADPFGFVRQLRERIVQPSSSGYGDTPVLCTRLRYESLPPVSGGTARWLAPISEVTLQLEGSTQTVLQRTSTTYLNMPGSQTLHGRQEASEVFFGDKRSRTRYFYSKPTSDSLETMELFESFETFDPNTPGAGLTKELVRIDSVLTGNTLLDRDDTDVVIKTTYDVLDRVIAETAAPGTAEEATRHYRYLLVDQAGGQAEQHVTDVKGVQTRTCFDGLNRAIYEERLHTDSPSRAGDFLQTYAAQYDALGQLAEETEFDWRLGDAPNLPGTVFKHTEFNWLADAGLPLKTTFEYDDWGQQCAATGPDNVVEHEQTDPTRLTTTAWREGMGKTMTTHNLFEKPQRVERRWATGSPYSVETNEYDGLGRLRKSADALNRQTSYGYDAFDRSIRDVLPDGAVVERQYASHSDEDLPTLISVNGAVLGTQTFDGLSRMIHSETGKRPKSYAYVGSQTQPASVCTAAGETIEYDYLAHLSDEPIARRVAGVSAGYTFDPQNARLLSGSESNHTLAREYFSTGELRSEQRVEAGDTRSMAYVYSLQGRLLSYTDVLGNTQTHTYDLAGRLVGTELGSTTSTLTYNAQGLNDSIDTRDTSIAQQVEVRLVYDDFGREIERHFDLGAQGKQRLSQSYNVLDQMSQRSLHEAQNLLRDEAFVYDERDRLVGYTAEGEEAPIDPAGKQIREQLFVCDALDNHLFVLTVFATGEGQAPDENLAEHFYSLDDPAQLVAVVNSHPDYAALDLQLTYDPNGNLLNDEAGRRLEYDALSRLVQVLPEDGTQGLSYGYDAMDILSSAASGLRFYCAGELRNIVEGPWECTIMRAGEALLAEHQVETAAPRPSKPKAKTPK